MTTDLTIIGSTAGAFVVFLAIVILGTRQEPRQIELLAHAPNYLAGTARWLLGVSVRRPAEEDDLP